MSTHGHYNQATAYSIAFGIDKVLFIYENRDTLDKKAYIRNITDDMKTELIGKIEYCGEWVKKLKPCPKPLNIDKKTCNYCIYRNRCVKDVY